MSDLRQVCVPFFHVFFPSWILDEIGMSPEGKFALQDVLPKKHLEVTTKKTQKKLLRMPQPISLHAFVGTSVWIESA